MHFINSYINYQVKHKATIALKWMLVLIYIKMMMLLLLLGTAFTTRLPPYIENAFDFTANCFVGFFDAAAFPSMSECVYKGEISLLNLADAIYSFIQGNATFEEITMNMGNIFLGMSAMSKQCQSSQIAFAELKESLGRFTTTKLFMDHVVQNMFWNLMQIWKDITYGIKWWGNWNASGKHFGRLVFDIGFEH
jgi:hypothetical protein